MIAIALIAYAVKSFYFREKLSLKGFFIKKNHFLLQHLIEHGNSDGVRSFFKKKFFIGKSLRLLYGCLDLGIKLREVKSKMHHELR